MEGETGWNEDSWWVILTRRFEQFFLHVQIFDNYM